jgi:phenylacetate-CoA ligase
MHAVAPPPRLADTGEICLAGNLDVLDRAEIEQLQTRNLAALVRASTATAAVRARFEGVESVSAPAELARLALMTPAQLAADGPPNSEALLLDGPGPGLVLRSSGTSGRPKVLYHSWSFTRQVGLLGARGTRACLDEPPRRVANCLDAGSMNGAFTFVQAIGQLLPALTFPLGAILDPHETADLIVTHEIDTLVAFPAFVVELAAGAPWPPGIRNALYVGEAMHATFSETLAAVAPSLNVRALAYSTNETGPIGYQCAHTAVDTYHVHEDAIIVEVVDRHTGAPLEDGCTGELVVTPLTDTGMALFRYRIGDRGRLDAQPCPCGSAARLLTLIGRTAQSIVVDGVIISDDLLMGQLARLGIVDPADCQLQLVRDGAEYEIALVVSPRAAAGLSTAAAAAALRADYNFERVLGSRRCTSFRVEFAERAEFARSKRGKIPLLLESAG